MIVTCILPTAIFLHLYIAEHVGRSFLFSVVSTHLAECVQCLLPVTPPLIVGPFCGASVIWVCNLSVMCTVRPNVSFPLELLGAALVFCWRVHCSPFHLKYQFEVIFYNFIMSHVLPFLVTCTSSFCLSTFLNSFILLVLCAIPFIDDGSSYGRQNTL